MADSLGGAQRVATIQSSSREIIPGKSRGEQLPDDHSIIPVHNGVEVRGVDLDPHTRCIHYHSPTDVVAIKMKCCGLYYACKDCHIALAGHEIAAWPRSEWDQQAVLCGACKTELSIREYLQSGSQCPACGSAFNPGCRKHHHFYFEEEEAY
ncbi:MAG TPA: CHY zinc finger protein [Candidatus Acidoferrum sp.]|nr:CHY zinc finger protein [Candidatus Acidoferrum sp.]